MSCCTIFNNPFFKDIKNIDAIASNDANFPKLNKVLGIIQTSIKPFTPEISGVWFPVVIKTNDTDINNVHLLRRSILESTVNPCNCSSISEDTTPFEEQVLDCEYCNKTEPINNTKQWSITDANTNKTYGPINSTHCNGANDVRMYPDDYLTKLPSLSNTNLTGNYDFKYLDQFPAVSNKGLGVEALISIPVDANNFNTLNGSNLKLCIDWRIQEKIGESPPDTIDSYYTHIDDHNKAYNRYLIHNKTCGNFILLSPNSVYDNQNIYPRYHWIDNCIGKITNSGLKDTQLPSTGSFTIPYGYKNTDHYNIFSSGDNKIGSYWKWNYTSGILCWYRHADKHLSIDEDKRIIRGIDLYISPGDVFYSTNQGPEPIPSNQGDIKPCPSGIKLIAENKTISGVIPPQSEFVYISQNIYPKVRNIFNKIHNLETDLNIPNNQRKTPRQKLELACLLGTCPDYDEITVDMLLSDPLLTTYTRNDFNRIDLFNKQMLKKTIYGSANDIGIIKNKKDLLNTLVNKYGCYILFPSSSNNSLNIGSETKESNIVFDLDFEPVIDFSKIATNGGAQGKKDCANTTVIKNFYYDQKIEVGDSFLETKQNLGYFNKSCLSGAYTINSAANTTSIYFSNALLDSFVYSTGSVALENIYLRPVSYDLALKLVGESICSQEQYSLCNKSLAIKYNNDLDLWGTPQERKEGKFKDDSVKLFRGYPASYFNPNINLCAFHRDGGVYFDSNTFGNNKLYFSKNVNTNLGIPKISFNNKDVSIKLYSLKIDKLRDQANPECKTLPLDQTCKCFNLYKVPGYQYPCDQTKVFTNRNNILYTPNLSTINGPTIKAYGDYTVQELINKFGQIVSIPNHPSPGSSLGNVNKIIDPLNPYGCYKNITFNLPNYVYTKWQLGLDKYVTDHTDIWVKVSDPSNLLNPTMVITNEDEEYEIINNPNYRRYNTEVKLNESLKIFDKQTDILFRAGESVPYRFSIEMTNPFLYSLLSQKSDNIDRDKKLYSPFTCSLDQSNTYAETTPYSYNITFTFEQIPRKHVLMYKIFALNSMGTLTKTFFHPNSGIRDELSSYGTSLVFNKDKCYQDFLYEQELFLQGKTPYNTSGVMYRGDINVKNQFILDNIDKLEYHKKLRLYVYNGNTWYEYINPHLLGFYNEHNNNIYPGMAAYFEYTNFDKPKTLLDSSLSMSPKNSTVPLPLITKPSTLIPASAKVNTKFNFINNSRFDFTANNYPDLGLYFIRNKNNPRSIILNSIRPYFLFDDKSIYISVQKIENISLNDTNISKDSVIYEESTKDYWKYHSGPKNNKYSYELLFDPSYFDNKFSNLHFSINPNTLDNDGGIVNDSIMDTTPTTVVLYNKKDFTQKTYSVIGKYIIADIVDESGNTVDKTQPNLGRRYIKIQTVLVFDMCDECIIEYNDGYMLPEDNQLKNFITIYQNLDRSLYGEFSSLLANRTIPYQTKWGDLLFYDFDKNFDLNNSATIASIINREYPTSLYKNIFDSVLINQLHTNKHKLLLNINQFTSSGQPFNIVKDIMDYEGELNYVLHQKYNIGSSDQYYDLYTSQYENFIPLLDISFLDRSFKTKQLFNITSLNTSNNVRTSGDIYISGVRGFTNSGLLNKNPKDYSYFLLSLDKNAEIKPVLFTNNDFYYNTLRVDDIYFPLLKNELVTEASLSAGCNSLLTNNIEYQNTDGSLYFYGMGFDKLNNNISRPYFETLVYCDSNVPGDPCYVESCRYKIAGRQRLKAEYQHLTHEPKKLVDIADNITAYAFGIDEGLYNFSQVAMDKIPYIQRFEIPPEDPLFNDLSNPYNISASLPWNDLANLERPIAPKYSYINNQYQTQLLKYVDTPQSDVVKNTDILANEMLFRSLYGSKQYINIQTIKKKTIEEALAADYSINPWSYLLQYSDIKTTPDKIYNFIPYDYDKRSDQSKRKVSGTIYINGVPSIGKSFTVVLGNQTIIFTIAVDEEGDIKLVASAGDSEIKKLIGQKFDKQEYVFAVELNSNGNPIVPPQPPNEYTTITRIDTCVGEEIKNWSIGSYYTQMEYTKIEDDKQVVVDLVQEYKKCTAGAQPFCGGGVPGGVDGFVVSYYTIPVGLCPILCPACNPRGYSDGIGPLPDNCTVVSSTVKAIDYNGLGRGIYGVNDEQGVGCPPRNGVISISPDLKSGNFDDLAGGTPVLIMLVASSCSPKNETCKPASCHELEAQDKFGKVFDVKRRGIYVGINGVGLPCECRPFSFGYCTPGQSSCNECVPYEPGFPKVFNYEFENKYSSFRSTGHLLRDKVGEPIVHNGQSIPEIPCPYPVGLEIPGNPSKFKSSERCYWTQCKFTNPSFGVYKSVSKTPRDYDPLCPSLLTIISYDNNVTTIDLFGNSQGNSRLCIKNEIRNDCPLIEITLPDDTFSVSDLINSECSMCDIESNKISMEEQNPEWSIITETRTAILGVISFGTDLNTNLIGGKGTVWVDKSICGESAQFCCWDNCYKAEAAVSYQCGFSAPDSWPWRYALNCELNGSPDPSFAPCIFNGGNGVGTGHAVLVNIKGGIGFENTSSNKSVAYAHKAHWEKRMTTAYNNTQACKNNNNLNVADIIEGVVPGSCSELKFGEISFPATAYRPTPQGGETAAVPYVAEFAYYTYKYRRPKTINDVLLGEELAPKCSTINPIAASDFSAWSAKNMAEKYAVKSKDCQTVPVCYDTTVSRCDENNFCCRVSRIDAE